MDGSRLFAGERFLVLLLSSSPLTGQEIVTLPTRPNVTQSYFLTSAPKNLQAIALLFPGSGGTIGLRTAGGAAKI